jgi:hypothetical protein
MRSMLKGVWELLLKFLKPEWAGCLDYSLGKSLLTLREPMNGQEARRGLTRDIIRECGIATIVETGTLRGTTTEWFAQFGLPVFSCEIDRRHAAFSTMRLRRLTNVTVHQCNSIDLLDSLAKQRINRSSPVLFYLDAHGHGYLPLAKEITLIAASFPKSVMLIDDFEVSGDSGYGFDDYGPGERLDVHYVLATKVPLSIYFPSTPSSKETGGRRGSVTLTADRELSKILDHVLSLRRWTQST